jgi:FKBP-type peptidyl-prolyl cis-trans isomerase 2
VLDFNHELAGKDLVFAIEVVEINWFIFNSIDFIYRYFILTEQVGIFYL